MPASAANSTELYRQIVLDHSRHPRNQRRLEQFDRDAEGHNTLCGDKVRVYLRLQGDTLEEISYEASGCAICLASASMMTEATRSHPLLEVRAAIEQFTRTLAAKEAGRLTGDLAALGGVSAYPSRVRCATLPWETLRAALDSSPTTVTTER